VRLSRAVGEGRLKVDLHFSFAEFPLTPVVRAVFLFVCSVNEGAVASGKAKVAKPANIQRPNLVSIVTGSL